MELRNFISPVLVFLSVMNCQAQDTSMILIPSGSSVLEKLPPAKKYKYQEFRTGKVFFKDGSIVTSQLNYSFLSGEVEFIEPPKDTLAIADDMRPLIKNILIDSTVFYYNKEFFEEIASYPGKGRLLKKQVFSEIDREKTGAYNMSSSTTAIQSFNTVYNRTYHSINDNVVNENRYIKVTEAFFIENKNAEVVPLTRKNLLRFYSSRKKEINDYLDKNQVNFNREEDLKRLFFAINK